MYFDIEIKRSSEEEFEIVIENKDGSSIRNKVDRHYLVGLQYKLNKILKLSKEAQDFIDKYVQLADRKVTMPEEEWDILYAEMDRLVPRTEIDFWLGVDSIIQIRKHKKP